MILVALHGFLGSPDDWSMAESTSALKALEVVAPDLSVWATRSEIVDLESFAEALNKKVRTLRESRGGTVAIAGYSLGARLAAHCLVDDPDLYSRALLISMNPGLPAADIELRRARLQSDLLWSERLRTDSWSSVCEGWNEQSVLKPGTRFTATAGKKAEARLKSAAENLGLQEGRRQAWARALEIWSLAHQRDLRKDLLDWAFQSDHRLTVMTGTDDIKFTELSSQWLSPWLFGAEKSRSGVETEVVRHRLVLGAGHRILNETPEDVVSELSSLLSEAQT